MLPLVVADIASCMTGYHPVMLKLGAEPGKAALMPVSDYKTFFRLIPKGSHFESAIVDYIDFFNKNIK